ncbi:hypothetical protein L1987_22053 [Smallanthus sonchifolius]|uniref:Uncharacterized protein n=1 Tax=Smallanthus sonchifolius TaxID=185202 RepID=A0ACB9IDT4_9ASTR|nr:hypothetical protein L1987_22053 [Smallanthus sonchifolius]
MVQKFTTTYRWFQGVSNLKDLSSTDTKLQPLDMATPVSLSNNQSSSSSNCYFSSIDYEMYSPNHNTKFDSVLLEQLISVKETVLGHCAVTTSKPVVACSDPKVVGSV